jgi:molybdate transport system substrate-binding protein
MNFPHRLVTVLGLLIWAAPAPASGNSAISIAAAANFVYALEALNAEFKRSAPEIRLSVTTGASGSLFAQIKNGAPFDVFLSADLEYPRQLVTERLGHPSTLRTFATGRLVAWTTRSDVDVSDLAAAIRSAGVKKIAIAQPRTAPYGRAAEAALATLQVETEAKTKIVFGESIAQTAQFVETGNADLGFVALSLVISPRLAQRGRWHEIAPAWYAGVSLDHAAVLTLRGATNPIARRYLEFLGSDAARKILRDFGYGVPSSTEARTFDAQPVSK